MASSRTRKEKLTELEGAILAAVRRGGAVTAYRLRQAFLASPSMEWSGSAGAVYPAMRRLKAAGFLSATPGGDGRGTEHYKLTASGDKALRGWSGDAARAVSAGTDPFRSRAPEWLMLRENERSPILHAVKIAIEARCVALKLELAGREGVERAQGELELELQRARLKWIAAHSKG